MRNLFIISRSSRKVNGIIQSESEDLRIREANGVKPSSKPRKMGWGVRRWDEEKRRVRKRREEERREKRRDEMRGSSSINEEEKKVKTYPSSTFCSMQILNELYKVCQHWGGKFTFSVHWFKCLSYLESCSQTYPETMFNLGTQWPAKLRQNYHTMNDNFWCNV